MIFVLMIVSRQFRLGLKKEIADKKPDPGNRDFFRLFAACWHLSHRFGLLVSAARIGLARRRFFYWRLAPGTAAVRRLTYHEQSILRDRS